MKKFWTRDGPIIAFLALVVTACGTPATPSPSDVAFAQTQQAMYVCATASALNMPNPCAPTSTPTPMPTATPMPSPTPIPFTGWKQFTEQGEWVRDMPLGYVPQCDGMVGCPGWMYIEYINGVPVGGGPKGTPGYWPYLLVGGPIVLCLLILMYFTAWNMAAPQRAMAKVTLMIGAAYAGVQQKSLPAPDGRGTAITKREQRRNLALPKEELGALLDAFSKVHEVPPSFEEVIGGKLNALSKGQLVPLLAIQTMLNQFDVEHDTRIARSFGRYLVEQTREKIGENHG